MMTGDAIAVIEAARPEAPEPEPPLPELEWSLSAGWVSALVGACLLGCAVVGALA